MFSSCSCGFLPSCQVPSRLPKNMQGCGLVVLNLHVCAHGALRWTRVPSIVTWDTLWIHLHYDQDEGLPGDDRVNELIDHGLRC